MSLAAELRQLALFLSLSEEDLAQVGQHVTVKRVGIHEPVFRIGDVGDSMYFVRFGEVKVVLPTEGGGEIILARLGRNHYFGEMALLTGEARSASVITTLDSEFFVLTKEGFDALFQQHPALALNLSHTLSQRLRETTAGKRERERVRTLCCFSTAGAVDGRYLSVHLAAAIARESGRRVALLDLNPAAASARPPLAFEGARWEDFLSHLERMEGGRASEYLAPTPHGFDVLSPSGGTSLQERLSPEQIPRVLSLLTGAYDFTLIDAGGPEGPRPLVLKAVDQAERVLFALPGSPRGFEEALALWREMERGCPKLGEKAHVVLRRGSGDVRGVIEQIEKGLGVTTVYQVPQDEAAESAFVQSGAPFSPEDGRHEVARCIRRMARRLAGIAVGVALGGGGARGFAHIGVLEVFEKENVPIDLIGGTSIGSIMAAQYAKGFSIEEMKQICKGEMVQKKPLNDYTFPRSAFLRGHKAERMMRRIFGDVAIEELALPYFSVGADLISGEAVVIDRGPLWLSVRASISLPGVLPPVKYQDRYLLVDGGVANNVPAVIIKKKGAQFSIAVNIAPERGEYFDFKRKDREAHGWLGRLLRKSRRLREFLDAPTIIRIIMRSINISSLEITHIHSRDFDVHLLPSVGEFDLFSFDQFDTLIQRGQEAAYQALPEIQEKMKALRA